MSGRLPSRRVGEILTSGRRAIGPHVVIFAAAGTGGVAFVAGRKVGNAVQRNRSRRLLRAAWGAVGNEARKDVDIVLVARAPIVRVGSPALAGEVVDLLNGERLRS